MAAEFFSICDQLTDLFASINDRMLSFPSVLFFFVARRISDIDTWTCNVGYVCVCAFRVGGTLSTDACARVKGRLERRAGNKRRGWEWLREREIERASWNGRMDWIFQSASRLASKRTLALVGGIGQGSALNLASTRNSNRVKYTASKTPPPDE